MIRAVLTCDGCRVVYDPSAPTPVPGDELAARRRARQACPYDPPIPARTSRWLRISAEPPDLWLERRTLQPTHAALHFCSFDCAVAVLPTILEQIDAADSVLAPREGDL